MIVIVDASAYTITGHISRGVLFHCTHIDSLLLYTRRVIVRSHENMFLTFCVSEISDRVQPYLGELQIRQSLLYTCSFVSVAVSFCLSVYCLDCFNRVFVVICVFIINK